MALPQIELLVGYPLGDPYRAFYRALFDGQPGDVTTTRFVVDSEAGYRVVFHGSFTVEGGEVTGGSVTGYDLFAGSSKTLKASGFDFEAASFFDAVQDFAMNTFPLLGILDGAAARVVGGKLSDYPEASLGDDVVLGKAGADILYGGDGNDTLRGGKGQDYLGGEDGFDTVYGGKGTDVFGFYFNLVDPPPPSFDVIKDFQPGTDYISIDVYDIGDPFLPQGFLDGKYFHKGTAAETDDQHVIYDKKSGKVFFDADGSGDVAQFQFAKVKPGTDLAAHDIYVGAYFS